MASSDLSNTPAIKSTRFFMRFAGFWIWNDRRSKIIMDFAMGYTIIAILVAWSITGSDLWFSRQDFYQAAYAACNAMTVLIILLKLTIFSIRRGAFMNLIKFCYENFWEREYDEFSEGVVRTCETRCVYFVWTFTFFAQCTVCSYTLHPILENVGKNETDRILPFNIWLDFPITSTPYYEVMFFIEIIHLKGAVASSIKKPQFNIGNIPVELIIREHTAIEEKGFFTDSIDAIAQTPIIVNWEDVADMEGRYVEIAGWVKMVFTETKNKSGDAIYSIGAISDGVELKLAVRVMSSASLPTNIFVGCAVTVRGLLQYDGVCPFIKVLKGSDIKLSKNKAIDPEILMDTALIPKKRAKKE